MFKRMTHARFARAGIASAVIAAAVIVAVSAGALSSSGKSQAAGANMDMTVTNPASAPIGGTFVAQVIAGQSTPATTYSGWSMELGYDPSKLTAISDTSAGLGGCTGGSFANAQLSPTVVDGCFGQIQTNVGAMDNITFQCIGPGTSALTLITNPPGTYGSNFNDEFAAPIATDLTNSSVNCVLSIAKSNSTGGTVLGGTLQSFTYTIHVGTPGAVSSGGHTVSDLVPAAVTVTGVTTTDPTGGGCGNVGNQVDCTALVALAGTGTDVVIAFDVPATAAAGFVCNTATLDTTTVSNNDCFEIKPPFPEVAMVKLPPSVDYFDVTTIDAGPPLAVTTRTQPLVNLWLCKALTCNPANGEGSFDINEFVVPSTVTGSDPQGVGAFEFQLKYDNHIFDILICEGQAPLDASGNCVAVNPLNVNPLDPSHPSNHWLYSTGRVPGATGVGGCAATIITENDIRFGCVSKNPNPPAEVTGVNQAGVAAIIHVRPKADLVNRITPGNDNGAIRSLLNEGCELADIYGHPLSAADGTPPIYPATENGYDSLGREIPLPGILPGGQIADCRDVTITVRILEGDMNLDCGVTVADDQIEASHYGAFFGNLLYQPWYDLEPWLKDGDVDIKDLQKVFGRNGSTCSGTPGPIPAQPALPEPVDP